MLNLIEKLRQVPALWNVSCKDYTDRNKTTDETARLAETFSTIKDEITKQLKSLKRHFEASTKNYSMVIRMGRFIITM